MVYNNIDHVYERSYPIYDEQPDTSSLVLHRIGDPIPATKKNGDNGNNNGGNNNNYNRNDQRIQVFVNPKKTIHLLAGTAGIGLGNCIVLR